MRVMVLTPYLPHAKVGHGGGTAVRDLVRHLARDHEVLLVALVRPGEESLVSEVRELGVTVAPIPFLDNRSSGLNRLGLMIRRAGTWLRSQRTGFPHYVEKYWSAGRRRRVLQLVKEFKPEAVQVEYLQMSLFARDIKRWRQKAGQTSPRIVLNTHELGSVPRKRRAERATNPWSRNHFLNQAQQWEQLQVAASSWADRCLCVTGEDHDTLAAQGGQNLLTVPLGMDLAEITVDREPSLPPTCLFLGSFNHRPNVLAAQLLVQVIWPLVRHHRPDARLVLAGPGSDQFLENRNPGEGTVALGFVDDLNALFKSSTLFVAPLPEGGGIKIKILEAMARGIPVVTTPVGAEGITCAQDDTLIIAPADEEFAQAVVRTLEDPEKEKRALRARAHMEKNFAWDSITRRLITIYRGEE